MPQPAVQPHGTYTFRLSVDNDTPTTLHQKTDWQTSCITKGPKERDLPSRLVTTETIEVKAACQSAGLLVQYRQPNTEKDRFADVTLDFLGPSAANLRPSWKKTVRGYNGLCAVHSGGTVKISQGTSATGCYKWPEQARSPHAQQFFKLTIENASGIKLSTFLTSSYCIIGTPIGTLADGETKTYSFETFRGNYRCDYAADFTLDYNPSGTWGNTWVAVDWAWAAPNVKLSGRGYEGYCVRKVADSTVRFYKC
ncbi:MAG TPA: hypothetical protein VFE36_03395 [Candidatus Baltobacteraceae bacterium]|nr:hypothetical protein [Candidatus Baltobacteraceae bacterium]